MDVDLLCGTVIRVTLNSNVAWCREGASGLVSFNETAFSVASRAMVISGAGGYKDTERGLTNGNAALFPTRSFSSCCSHISSSIICAFCRRRVSCMFLFSLCHRRWASSLLFGSTRGNSFSWNERIKGMSQGARASTYRRWCFSVIGLSTLEQACFLPPCCGGEGTGPAAPACSWSRPGTDIHTDSPDQVSWHIKPHSAARINTHHLLQ